MDDVNLSNLTNRNEHSNYYKLKKTSIILSCLALISVASIFPQFLKGVVFSQDDVYFQIMRLEEYTNSVKQLDLFPKIFSEAASGLGYGIDIFNPSILLLPYSILRIIGFSFVTSFYFYHFFISFITSIIAFKCSLKISLNTRLSLVFSILYTLSTYRLIDQSVRGALSETLFFTFLPIVVLGIYNIFYTKNKNWITLAIGMTLSFYSHTTLTMYLTFIVLVFYLFNIKKEFSKAIIPTLKSALVAIILTAFVTLPIYEQMQHAKFEFQKYYFWEGGNDFSLGNLILNSINNVSGPFERLKPNVGIILFLGLVIGLINFKKFNELTKKSIIISSVAFLAVTNLLPWAFINNTFLSSIQFQWRLLVFITFSLCVTATMIIDKLVPLTNKNIFRFLLVIITLSISQNVYHIRSTEYKFSQQITNESYSDFNKSSIGHNAEFAIMNTLPKDTMELVNSKHFSEINGESVSINQSKTDQNNFNINISNDSTVNIPRFYYYGYQVYIGNLLIPNRQQDGLVSIDLPKGNHNISIHYEKTLIQKLSLLISVVGWIVIILLSLFYRLRKVDSNEFK